MQEKKRTYKYVYDDKRRAYMREYRAKNKDIIKAKKRASYLRKRILKMPNRLAERIGINIVFYKEKFNVVDAEYRVLEINRGLSVINKSSPICYIIHEGCWLCVSHALDQTGGYPICRHNGKQIHIGRVVLECSGHDMTSLFARHTCDNTHCINPSHLIPGTLADNNKDRVERNRGAVGERASKAKLTAKQVLVIRNSQLPALEIAKTYGISISHARNLRRGKSWKHLNHMSNA